VLNKIQDSIFPEFELYQYTPTNSAGNFNLSDGYYILANPPLSSTGSVVTVNNSSIASIQDFNFLAPCP